MASLKDNEYKALYEKARQAGLDAIYNCTPTPMVVQQSANQMDGNSPVVKEYHIPGGVCGFAWIIIRPANRGFTKWARKQGLSSKAYCGGEQIWVHEGGQSYEKKKAYAGAFAQVLRDAGLNAYMGSRLD